METGTHHGTEMSLANAMQTASEPVIISTTYQIFLRLCRLRAPSFKFCSKAVAHCQNYRHFCRFWWGVRLCIARHGSLQGLRAIELSNLFKTKINCWKRSPCVVCLHLFDHKCSLSLKSLVDCLHWDGCMCQGLSRKHWFLSLWLLESPMSSKVRGRCISALLPRDSGLGGLAGEVSWLSHCYPAWPWARYFLTAFVSLPGSIISEYLFVSSKCYWTLVSTGSNQSVNQNPSSLVWSWDSAATPALRKLSWEVLPPLMISSDGAQGIDVAVNLLICTGIWKRQ